MTEYVITDGAVVYAGPTYTAVYITESAQGPPGISGNADLITALGAMISGAGNYVAHTTSYFIDGNATVTEDLLDLDAVLFAGLVDSLSRAGDTMDAEANLAFSGGGEVVGLPSVPSISSAAISKGYADSGEQTLTNKTLDGSVNNITDVANALTTRLHVRKASSGTILKGKPVYITGYSPSGYIQVEAADAASASTMPSIGLAAEDITNNEIGHVIGSGILDGWDTSGFAEGVTLFVAVGGGLTETHPIGTALIQNVGEVTRAHSSSGSILTNGPGRANAVPNIPNGYFWMGNGGGGVATEFEFDAEVTDLVRYETLAANGDVGYGADQVSAGDHGHNVAGIDVFDNTGGQDITGSTITVNIDTERTNTDGAKFSLANDEVTVNVTAVFEFALRVSTYISTGTNSSTYAWLEVDTGGGFVVVDGTQCFMSNAIAVGGHDTGVARGIISVTSGDKFRLRCARKAGTGTCTTLADGSALTFHRN